MSRGIPVSCEVDIYGALSEYIGMCVSGDTVTLLDINNSVPADLYREDIEGRFPYQLTDTFMGFHCGNTPSCKLCADRAVKYQLIQHRLLEPKGSQPTSPGHPGGGHRRLPHHLLPPAVRQRGQAGAPTSPRARCCPSGPAPSAASASSPSRRWAASTATCWCRSATPHHGAVAFGHYGKALFEVMKLLGVEDIAYNQPRSLPYPTENPFA